MTTLDIIKNSLIDKIIATNNEKLLSTIANILESAQSEEKIRLTSEQIKMLMLSENDIKCKKLISEDELIKFDLKWLY